jgi:MFS family permease
MASAPGTDRLRKRRLKLTLPRTFSSLRHPDFRLLWVTSVLNAGGNWLQQVTLGWLAFDLTGSALAAGLAYGVRSLPSILIGPIGGVLGDRFERKRGLQVNSGYMAILACGFALLLAVGDVQLWHILLFTTLQGFGQALVGPVRQAMVANTVPREDLMNAIALNSFAFSTMRVAGPALAGVLILFSGPALNFGIQSSAYVITFLLILPLKTPYSTQTRRANHGSMVESFVEGVRYVRHQPTILGLILLALAPSFFTTPINLGLLPVYAKEALGADAGGLGLLYSMQGVGAVFATLTLASLGNYRHKGLLLSVAAIGLATSITLYSQVSYFVLALPFVCAATCCFTTYNTMNQTIIQTVTPDEYRGRVMGLHMMDHGLTPLGALLWGSIAEFYGVSTAILIAGVCGLSLVLLILARFPAIPTYRSGLGTPPSEPPPPRPARSGAATTGAASD